MSEEKSKVTSRQILKSMGVVPYGQEPQPGEVYPMTRKQHREYMNRLRACKP